jgi:hypothetical protein
LENFVHPRPPFRLSYHFHFCCHWHFTFAHRRFLFTALNKEETPLSQRLSNI